MVWYHYVAAFFAGLFLANSVPHFLHGLSGDRYPTPFANPPGRGLSSPRLNVLWAVCNLVIGALLIWGSNVANMKIWGIILFLAGIAVICVSGVVFATKRS